jgi:hypothetical protein
LAIKGTHPVAQVIKTVYFLTMCRIWFAICASSGGSSGGARPLKLALMTLGIAAKAFPISPATIPIAAYSIPATVELSRASLRCSARFRSAFCSCSARI